MVCGIYEKFQINAPNPHDRCIVGTVDSESRKKLCLCMDSSLLGNAACTPRSKKSRTLCWKSHGADEIGRSEDEITEVLLDAGSESDCAAHAHEKDRRDEPR
jgi:hypothetical protein